MTQDAASLSNWRARLHQPIFSGLLFSLSLHLALLALIQPAPGGGGMETLVIQARLATPPPEIAAAVPEVPLEPEPEPLPAQPEEAKPLVQPTPAPAPALLTSNVPSPAPPLPVAPTPIVEAPKPEPVAPSLAEIRPQSAPAPGAVGPTARHETSAPISVGIDTTWYLARQVDTSARAANGIIPDYPDEARRRNKEGTLKLMLKIDDLGRVRDVEVVEADLPGVFDEAAIEAFRQARFHPAMKDGRPVRYQAYIRVVFKLRD